MKANHDLSSLVKFLSRDDWAVHFEEVMGDHFWAAMDEFDLEHEEIGEAVHAIRHLARDYAIPGDACTTFVVTYQKLKEFEDDLHKHVHLENNILFPKAADL